MVVMTAVVTPSVGLVVLDLGVAPERRPYHARRVPRPMLDHLELVQRLFPVEQANVLRLRGRESAHRPAQVYEVGLHRVNERVHPDLPRQPIPLASVAGGAGGDAVRPIIRPAAGERDQVIAR